MPKSAQLTAQLYTLRDFTKTPADMASTFRRVRKIGYEMKGRMDQVHLKDAVILGDQLAFAEIGEGNLNWPAILKACKVAGVRHYIVEQDACPVTNDPFKSLAISYRNLREMGLK